MVYWKESVTCDTDVLGVVCTAYISRLLDTCSSYAFTAQPSRLDLFTHKGRRRASKLDETSKSNCCKFDL